MAEYIKRTAVFEQFDNADADVCETDDFGGVDYGFGMKNIKELINAIPAAEAVSLHDIYRVIAGHSYYHGDRILAALSCIVEGKEVNPVRPADVAPVVHGRWVPFHSEAAGDIQYCSACEIGFAAKTDYCPHCGAKMDIKGQDDV
nr:MAG TPA: zinc-ribbon containing domain protein [Caudoviricetes sp.]